LIIVILFHVAVALQSTALRVCFPWTHYDLRLTDFDLEPVKVTDAEGTETFVPFLPQNVGAAGLASYGEAKIEQLRGWYAGSPDHAGGILKFKKIPHQELLLRSWNLFQRSGKYL
jgi:hypothetical protein